MKKVLMLCALVVLAGCDAGTSPDNSSAEPKAVATTANYFSKNAIYLPDGAGIEFGGVLRRYDLLETDKGTFDRYTFEFSNEIMALEGSVFATLAKSGYQRKVRHEDATRFVVNYVKKGFPVISMTFERVAANKATEAFTRLRLVWKHV